MTARIKPSQGGGEHTPTPWKLGGHSMLILPVAGGGAICKFESIHGMYANYEANGAFIVECVNSHATLKARIEELESETARLSALWIGETRRVEALETALREIACFDDTGANRVLLAHGTYISFDEPWSVKLARATLASGEAALTSTECGGNNVD